MAATRLVLPTALGGVALGILAVDAIGLSPLPFAVAGAAAAFLATATRAGAVSVIALALLAVAVGCWLGAPVE